MDLRAAELVETVREATTAWPREEAIAFWSALEAVKLGNLLPVAMPATKAERQREDDSLLSPNEIGARIRRSRDWVYRNRGGLPRVVLPNGRWGVRRSKLEAWLSKREAAS